MEGGGHSPEYEYLYHLVPLLVKKTLTLQQIHQKITKLYLVRVFLGSLRQDQRCRLANIIRADKAVPRTSQRIAEIRLRTVDVLGICLQQMIHEEIVSQHGERQTSVDQRLLAPPEGGNFSAISCRVFNGFACMRCTVRVQAEKMYGRRGPR